MRIPLLLIAIIALAGCERPPSLTVDGELLVGKYVGENVAAFLGIPFAEPPVGDLRWRAPQALTSKQERRDTTEFAPACMQTMRILDWYRYMAETFGASPDYYEDLEVSEDCLYLNIWTPTLDSDARLPVMVWIHGGSNISGWSRVPAVGTSARPHHGLAGLTPRRHGPAPYSTRPDVTTSRRHDVTTGLQPRS